MRSDETRVGRSHLGDAVLPGLAGVETGVLDGVDSAVEGVQVVVVDACPAAVVDQDQGNSRLVAVGRRLNDGKAEIKVHPVSSYARSYAMYPVSVVDGWIYVCDGG